jgi:predicted phosphodiesterase
MRVYFFGDIHGNIHALEACLKHLSEIHPDETYCLGDLVGWLPFGDRSLARMRSLPNIPTVAGNHDLLVAGLFTDHPDQLDRMQATAYNAGLLSTIPGAIDYLLNLPLRLEKEEFTVVHHSPFHLPSSGNPATIQSFNYLDEAALRESLKAWRAYRKRLIVSGHDHVPAVYELPDAFETPRLRDVIVRQPPKDGPFTIRLNPRSRYWIKAGSVGGPYRDGVAVANSVLYDSNAETVTLFRIPYPTEQLRRELASHFFTRNLPTLRKYETLLNAGKPAPR